MSRYASGVADRCSSRLSNNVIVPDVAGAVPLKILSFITVPTCFGDFMSYLSSNCSFLMVFWHRSYMDSCFCVGTVPDFLRIVPDFLRICARVGVCRPWYLIYNSHCETGVREGEVIRF